MLHQFLTANRAELIDRCRRMVARRSAPKATDGELTHGIPLFLDQMVKTLRVEQTSDPMLSREVSGPSGGGQFLSEIGASAALHGRELLQNGFTVEQVVHDYGDLCQAITDLAFESGTPIATDEFRTLNRCIDNGIADAVTEYSYQRNSLIADRSAHALNERLGILAHELRNLIHTATLAVTAIKKGNVGIGGATGAVLDRSLIGLRSLIDRSLAEVRLNAGMPAQQRLIPLTDFVVEVEVSAALEAGAHGCKFSVSDVDPGLAVDGDRDMLLAAVGNLLQNAFKFTQARTEVSLKVHAAADRILIEVEDHCGGLPPGVAEDLFQPFRQGSKDKSGLGWASRSVVAALRPTTEFSESATSPALDACLRSICLVVLLQGS